MVGMIILKIIYKLNNTNKIKEIHELKRNNNN